jgi:predicted TIM-barrel fold metal-dependent hydrolase
MAIYECEACRCRQPTLDCAGRSIEVIRPAVVSMLPFLLAVGLGAQETCEIIDVHQHANPAPASFLESPPPRLCPNGALPCDLGQGRFRTSAALLDGTLAAMDRNSIRLAFVSSYDLDNVDRWLDRAPDRFRAGASWGPGLPMPAMDGLRARHAAGRLSIVGELGPQYGGLTATDPIVAPYLDLAHELDVPVLMHMTAVGGSSDEYLATAGRPLTLEPALKKRPGLRVYLENSGYPFGDEMIALFAQYPRVYGDLSRISWYLPRHAFYDYVRKLVRAGYGDRLMFGSDQSWWPEVIDDAVDAIRSAPFLSSAEKCAIFSGNARRFFDLGGDG